MATDPTVQYADMRHPLTDAVIPALQAKSYIASVLDMAGVPREDDNGESLPMVFRLRWLIAAYEELRVPGGR